MGANFHFPGDIDYQDNPSGIMAHGGIVNGAMGVNKKKAHVWMLVADLLFREHSACHEPWMIDGLILQRIWQS